MIIRKELRQNLWKIIGGLLVLTAVAVFVIVAYPFLKETFSRGFPSGAKLPPQFQTQLARLKDFRFYVASQWFNKNLLQLGFILALLLGMGAVAGEIQAKTAEFLLSKPISRSRVIFEKFCTLCCVLSGSLLISTLAIYPATLIIGKQLPIARILLAVLSILPSLLVVFSYTFFFSTIFNDQIKTAGAAIGVSVIFVILDLFKKTQKLSIFYYAEATKTLLKGEVPWGNIVGLLTISAVFLVVSIYVFQSRDI